MTLAQFVLPAIPANDDVGEIIDASGESVTRIGGLYIRGLGRLVLTAEDVERRLGLAPIKIASAEAGTRSPSG